MVTIKSIEEKAHRYDEAIEIAKEINNEQRAQPFDVMTRVFPELKESDDEKVRMVLREIVLQWKNGHQAWCSDDKEIDTILAWLEKQGEQKHTDVRTTGYWHVGDVEQKPVWSEEDCLQLDAAISIVANSGHTCTSAWLKSLKERYTWKPSDEQMDALRYVTNFDYGGYKAILVSLCEQLKKLREE